MHGPMHAAPAASRPLLEGVKNTPSYLGKNLAKLDDTEITANFNGASRPTPPFKSCASTAISAKTTSGPSSPPGYDDAQVTEIVLHVALKAWTNYINEIATTDIEFPWSPPAQRAAGPPLT